MSKIINVQQGTDEWRKVRAGHLTASNAQAIATAGKGLETYIYTLLAEKYSKNTEHYSNKDTERGHDFEPIARDIYELLYEPVKQVGFIEIDEMLGCSPDGLVGEDGLIEIKCPNDVNYYKIILGKKPENKYIWQAQMLLLLTKRKWCDLIFYNPNFDKELIVHRIEPDKKSFEKLEKGIEKGKQLIKELKIYG